MMRSQLMFPCIDCFSLPLVARNAIEIGRKRGDAVAEMERLGLSVRVINQLENHGIIFLWQLVLYERRELLQVPSFGDASLVELMGCLAKYHELSDGLGLDTEEENRRRELVERGLALMPRPAAPKANAEVASVDEHDEVS